MLTKLPDRLQRRDVIFRGTDPSLGKRPDQLCCVREGLARLPISLHPPQPPPARRQLLRKSLPHQPEHRADKPCHVHSVEREEHAIRTSFPPPTSLPWHWPPQRPRDGHRCVARHAPVGSQEHPVSD